MTTANGTVPVPSPRACRTPSPATPGSGKTAIAPMRGRGSHPPGLRAWIQLALTLALLLAVVSPARSRLALATEQAPAASYRLDAAVDLAAGTVDTTEVVRLRNVVGVPLPS